MIYTGSRTTTSFIDSFIDATFKFNVGFTVCDTHTHTAHCTTVIQTKFYNRSWCNVTIIVNITEAAQQCYWIKLTTFCNPRQYALSQYASQSCVWEFVFERRKKIKFTTLRDSIFILKLFLRPSHWLQTLIREISLQNTYQRIFVELNQCVLLTSWHDIHWTHTIENNTRDLPKLKKDMISDFKWYLEN